MELKRSTVFISASGLLALGIAAGWTAPSALRSGAAMAAESSAGVRAVSAPQPPGPVPYGYAPDYRTIVAQNRAAVVGITVESHTPVSERGFSRGSGDAQDSPFGDDPFFRFFRELPIPRNNTPTRSLGSGFIVRSDGVILTMPTSCAMRST